MKFYLITDDVDTSVGLRLAGVEGKVLSDLSQGQSALPSVRTTAKSDSPA